MNWEQALRQRLLDDGATAALVGTRIDWRQRPQQGELPALVLNLISDPRPQTMKGFQQLRASRVQVDCYAKKPADVVSLREAAIAALVVAGEFNGVRFERGFIDALRELGEKTETGFVHRDSIDFMIWHE